MKNERTLKKVLIIFCIILLALFALLGAFVKDGNSYRNILPEFSFGKNLSGSRLVTIKPEMKTVYRNENGEVVTEKTDTTTTAEEPVNAAEVLNKENYEASKKVISGRIATVAEIERKSSSVAFREDMIKTNYETGEMVIELPNSDNIESVIEYFAYQGVFEVVDTETQEVLLTNDNIKDVSGNIYVINQNTGEKGVYLTFEFDAAGKKKLREISKTYVTLPEDKNTTENAVAENTVAENTTAENTVTNEVVATAENVTTDGTNTTTAAQRNITLKIEGQDILTTNFSEELTDGKLQLSIGTISVNTEDLQEYLQQAQEMSILLNSGKMPVKYAVTNDLYMESAITSNMINVVIIAFAVIVLLIFVYMIIKYKIAGLYCVISYLGTIALCLLLVRGLKLKIVIESAVAIAILIIANTYLVFTILSKIGKNLDRENVKKAITEGYKKFVDIGIFILAIGIVFTFTKWVAIESIGTIVFWGIISIIVSNILFTNTLLLNISNKK